MIAHPNRDAAVFITSSLDLCIVTSKLVLDDPKNSPEILRNDHPWKEEVNAKDLVLI
jgi:hypothetical protein